MSALLISTNQPFGKNLRKRNIWTDWNELGGAKLSVSQVGDRPLHWLSFHIAIEVCRIVPQYVKDAENV